MDDTQPAPPDASSAAGARGDWRHRLIAVSFLLAIGLPLALLWPNRARDAMPLENRRAAAWPGLAASELVAVRKVAKEFEAAFNDRFGGREALIFVHNLVGVVLYAKSASPRVAVGRDGWLFYTADRTYGAYMGSAPAIPEAFVDAIVAGMVRRVRAMAAIGVPYLIVIAPDKHTIYPEQLRQRPLAGPGRSLLAAVMERLPEDIRPSVVDTRAAVLAAKLQGRTYWATDSHWNYFGGWAAYAEVSRRLGLEPMPYPPRAELIPRQFHGDLAAMTQLGAMWREDDLLPAIVAGRGPCQKPDPAVALPLELYRCEGARPGRLVMYRDSFGQQMQPWISAVFEHSAIVSNYNLLDLQGLQRDPPTIVLDEVVERGLVSLAITPLALQPPQESMHAKAAAVALRCSLDGLAVTDGNGLPARVVAAAGWIADAQRLQPVERAWLVLDGSAGEFVAEIDSHPRRPWVSRPDLGTHFGAPAMADAAFDLRAGATSLPPGEHRATLFGQVAGAIGACATPRTLTIPALPPS